MKINIDHILETGLTFQVDSAKEPWLKTLFVSALGDKVAAGDELQLTLTVNAIGTQIECMGGYYYTMHPTCDRCGKVYELAEQLPLHFYFIQAEEAEFGRKNQKVEEVDAAEDENFSLYEGRFVELDAMLYEQLLLAQPVIYLCQEDCQGLCTRCLTDLNQGPCGCPPEEKITPFDALKGLKITKQ